MRKKTVNHVADTIFWYLIYFLPVIVYLLYMLSSPGTGTNIIEFSQFFESIGFGFVSDNIIISSLTSIFGQGGILPLFTTNTPFIIFSWFISAFLCHLLVDFLLFIPRLCHKYLKVFYQEDK